MNNKFLDNLNKISCKIVKIFNYILAFCLLCTSIIGAPYLLYMFSINIEYLDYYIKVYNNQNPTLIVELLNIYILIIMLYNQIEINRLEKQVNNFKKFYFAKIFNYVLIGCESVRRILYWINPHFLIITRSNFLSIFLSMSIYLICVAIMVIYNQQKIKKLKQQLNNF